MITGIVVFVLTSVYNHWRDRVQRKIEKRIFFDDIIATRTYSELIEGREMSPGKFLADSNFESFESMKKEKDFKLTAHIMKNLGEFTIFDITIKYKLSTGKEFHKFFMQYKMDSGETFIIPLGTSECPRDVKRHSVRIGYTTSGRERFAIYKWSFKKGRYSSAQLECKYYWGVIKLPIKILMRRRVYHTQFKSF
ncbi:hypothetical protein ACFPRA_01440 [Sporosarcina soli]|uniref:SMODS-associating 2TM beta-strand rich effector domain-containing protein n=1 Tax=Sporosarcina soli TaxID=334736 RepID=A0ABW0TFY4_9BACL